MSTSPPSNQSGALLPIGTVVAEIRQTFPDVSHSSLRFLEREGLISATRTPGGHRLYTRGDIERIRQIKTWQAQRLSLDDIRQRLARLDQLPPPAVLAETFLHQALAGRFATAYNTVLTADDLGMPLTQLFGDVLQPALTELGRRWAHGELLVAQEKEVSELTRDLIAEITLGHAHPEPRGPVLVAACVEGERHELGLRMVCGLLRAKGYVVHYLGADVAPNFLLEAVQLHHPEVLLLSAKLEPNLPAVKAAIAILSSRLNSADLPAIVVGGQVAIEHPEDLRAWGAVPITDERLDAALPAVASVVPTSCPER